jgi:cystathionine beta-lyase/cystathionine gamma-synthase
MQAPGIGRPLSPPLTRSSTFEYPDRASHNRAIEGSDRFYARNGHEIGRIVEARMAQLEGAEGALLFASGIAAVTALLLGLSKNGSRLAVSRFSYGGTLVLCKDVLPGFGIHVDFFDPFDAKDLDRAFAANPDLIQVETPINPTLRLLDIQSLASRAHAKGALLSVDATFIPPPFQRCLEKGADLVVHSATKFFGGHSDVLAGVILGRDAELVRLEDWRRMTGPILGQDAAWLLNRSLETLELRFREQSARASDLARYLDVHRDRLGIETIHYPGLPSHPDHDLAMQSLHNFGSMLSIQLHGGLERAARVFDALCIFHRGPSLGGSESLVCLPAETSHAMLSETELSRIGFDPGLLRFSVGLEPLDVLTQDLEQAILAQS